MVDEVTQVETPRSDGSHTTVIREGGASGGAGWLIAIVLLIAVIAGIYFFSQMSNSQAVKDNAVAGAAQDVGNAASKVGNAVDDTATNK
ncbi:MAG: hypothetical protein ABIT04_01880 [Novosphingobium sp.]